MEYQDILETLSERFPDEVVHQKDAGHGQEVDFVPWHLYVKRLNEELPGEWESDVAGVGEIGGQLVVRVAVTAGGITHVGLGTADATKTSWGGAMAEAYSQGFRRACAMHGMGLYFYHQKYERPEDAATETQVERLTEIMPKLKEADPEKYKLARNKLKAPWTPGAEQGEYLTEKLAGVIIRKVKEALAEDEAPEEPEEETPLSEPDDDLPF